MMKNEPVMTLVVALIVAGGGLLAAFGVDVTQGQIAAISAFAVAALALGAWVRANVMPLRNMAKRGSALKDERGVIEPLTLLVYVIVIIILIAVLFAVLDRI